MLQPAIAHLLVEHLPTQEVLGELVTSELPYCPHVTREKFRNQAHVTDLLEGRLRQDLQLPPLDPAHHQRSDLRRRGNAATSSACSTLRASSKAMPRRRATSRSSARLRGGEGKRDDEHGAHVDQTSAEGGAGPRRFWCSHPLHAMTGPEIP